MTPTLSVIVPVYRVEPYIRQCLDSLVNQTYQDMEVIVIDDGSPDNCGAICDEYASKYPKLRVIHQENAGVGAARNRGLDKARGNWITFVDSDDWLDTNYYESIFRELGSRKVDIFCANGFIKEYPNSSALKYSAYQDFECHDREHLDVLMAQVIYHPAYRLYYSPSMKSERHLTGRAVVWDKFYRADFLKNHALRFYDRNRKAFWDDSLFNWTALDVAESVAGCDVIGYHYRQSNASFIHSYNPSLLSIQYDFMAFLRKAAPQKLENPLFQQSLYANALSSMLGIIKQSYLHPSNSDAKPVVKKRIREMTRMPYYHEALHKSSNRFLTKKLLLVKCLLRQPFLWPLELAVKGNAWLKRGNPNYE